ncbi:MAG: Calx-beta domain-containing protein [Planctomycetota bacterium]
MNVQRHSQRFGRASSDQPAMIELLEPRTLLAVLPVVSVDATTPAASENGDRGQFTITLDAPAAAALKINFKLTGTATNGTDYSHLPGSVTIPAGQSSALVTVVPIDDGRTEPQEAVVLTLSSSSKYQINLAQSGDTVTIADATYLATDFFPMTDGVRWDYVGNTKGVSSSYYQYNTMADQGGDSLFSAHSSITGNWTVRNDLLRTVAGSVFLVWPQFAPRGLLLPAYIGPGAYSRIDSFYGEFIQTPYTETVETLGFETVNVPAGRFRALKVRRTFDEAIPNLVREETTSWYVRGHCCPR